MEKRGLWLVRSIIYSAIIFSIVYLLVYFRILPNLWEGYLEMFTIKSIIIVSLVCGFTFVIIKEFLFKKETKQNKK